MSLIAQLGPDPEDFPPPERALRRPDGLLAIGGDLSVPRLLAAYRRGIFPWYEEPDPILWWTPDPRAVLFPEELHLSASLRKQLRRGRFQVSADTAFAEVVGACAAPRAGASGTWIGPRMQRAYLALHRAGYAHSVEVREGDRLVGGLYGVAIGRVFFGESMFARVPDASKIGFARLAVWLREKGFALIDCQQDTEHMRRFGARCIARAVFQDIVSRNTDLPGCEAPWELGGQAGEEAWAIR